MESADSLENRNGVVEQVKTFVRNHLSGRSGLKWSTVLGLMLIGAAGFWLPDVVFHAATNVGAAEVRVITVVLPITLLLTCLLTNRIGKFGEW